MLGKIEKQLSPNEFEVIKLAQDQCITAFKKRAANPADFNTNITCLKELTQAMDYWMAVVSPHLEKKIHAEYESASSCCSFFRNRAKEKALNEILIMDSMEKMLNNIQDFSKEQFTIEPRIISLNYKPSYKLMVGKKIYPTIPSNKEMYTITFSDNSRITLSNLNTESIDQARVKFTEKMSQLAETNCNIPKFK